MTMLYSPQISTRTCPLFGAKNHANEAMANMPHKDPNNWRELFNAIAVLWASMPELVRALILYFPVSIAIAIRSHGRKPSDAVWDAVIGAMIVCICDLAVSMAGFPSYLSIVIVGALAGLGLHPTVEIAKDLLHRFMDKILPKKG